MRHRKLTLIKIHFPNFTENALIPDQERLGHLRKLLKRDKDIIKVEILQAGALHRQTKAVIKNYHKGGAK